MSMLPQPPPDAPAPPPSEAAILSQKKWKWLWAVGLCSIFGLLLSPLFIRSRHRHSDAPPAIDAARIIGLALSEFQNEFGQMPDAGTIQKVRQKSGTDLKLGTETSNDFFRQLMASGTARSERMFYAKISGTRIPDDVFAGAKALEKGECGFTYFMGATASSYPSRPIVVTPMIPGTDRFDPKPFNGKVVILKLDNSVATLPIDKDGHVLMAGRNLMDPTNPIWEGHPPVIAWPE